MTFLKLLCAPVVLAVAVAADMLVILAGEPGMDKGLSATERAVKTLIGENK